MPYCAAASKATFNPIVKSSTCTPKNLRLMELSGELLAGYFFTGIEGPQFISPEAFRLLQKGLDEDAVYWLNASDPVSLCGIGPEPLRAGLPARVPSTLAGLSWLAPRRYREEKRPGAGVFLPPRPSPSQPLPGGLVGAPDPGIHAAEDGRGRQGQWSAPARSEYLQDLKSFGFTASHRGLELRRSG